MSRIMLCCTVGLQFGLQTDVCLRPDHQLISELPTGAETGRSSQKSRTSEVEYVAAAAACDQ